MDAFSFITSHRVILAPMAGVTDRAFRRLCCEQGAQLAFTEMVSSKALSYSSKRSADLVELYDGEGPVGVQLFGHEPTTMADQARWVEQELGQRLAVVDLNMGCPVRKIAGKGDGAALMKDHFLASRIIEATANAVDAPVSVKFRRGYHLDQESAPDFAAMAQESGAAWLCVHGRYAQQMYAGLSDPLVILRVKQRVSIPVIGNGDVRSGSDARRLMELTGCDAVMIARAAQGNPWIFAQVLATLQGGCEPPQPSTRERIAMAKRHTDLLAAMGPRAVLRMRKHAAWYCKGLPGSAAARARLNTCTQPHEFHSVLDDLLARMDEEGA